MKSEYQKQREAKQRAAKLLEQTKRRLRLGAPQPLRGATRSPLVAQSWERKPSIAPTSDRIPGPAHSCDFMHAHQWKDGVSESGATLNEIRRKASKIAPAYNKGALQYLPESKN